MSDIKQEIFDKLRPDLKRLETHYVAVYQALHPKEAAAFAALTELFKTASVQTAAGKIPGIVESIRKQKMC